MIFSLSEDKKSAMIFIMGDIADYMGATSADDVISAIEASPELDSIDVYLSSAGGYVKDGVAMYNYLKEHSAKVTTHNYAAAESVASVVLLAGDERIGYPGSTIFVHRPLSLNYGHADEVQSSADGLKKTEAAIIELYAKETGLESSVVEQMMKTETTLTPTEALENGFLTKVSELDETDRPSMFMKEAAVMARKQQQVRGEVVSMKSKTTELEKKLKSQATASKPVSASMINQACKDAGLPQMLSPLIEMKPSKETLEQHIKMAKNVAELCDGAGIEAEKVMEKITDPLEMMRTAINLQAVKLQQDIDGNIPNKPKLQRRERTPAQRTIHTH